MADKKIIQLKVGKTYKSRSGEIVTIVSVTGDGVYSFGGGNGRSYTKEGVWWSTVNNGVHDLISEVSTQENKCKRCPNSGSCGMSSLLSRDKLIGAKHDRTFKDTNPKDVVGTKKWRVFTTIPLTVIAELGAAMLEGARKYGRHNYRVSGVRASVYVDAAIGHIMQWWEGEDIDIDSGISHITKAMASLAVLRDAMMQEKLTDDRPPKAKLAAIRDNLQAIVDSIFKRHPNATTAYTEFNKPEGENDD